MNRHLNTFLRHVTAIVAAAAVLTAPQAAMATPITMAGWDFNGLSTYGASPQAPGTAAANLTIVGLTRGVGVGTGGTAASNAWGGTTWDGKSLTFSFTADTGYDMSFDSFSNYNVRRSSAGATDGQWQYQVGAGEFTDIGSPITWGSTTTASGNAQSAITLSGISDLQTVAAGTTVTFRLNLSGGTTGTWYLNNFQAGNDFSVLGTVTASGGGSDAYYWVGDDTTLGGSGTWAQTGGNAWRTTDTDGTGEAWDSTKTATFGGVSAGTVTVSNTINADAGLTFSTTGYTLSGGTVSLDGASAAANTITTNAATAIEIDSILSGSNGLTKAGAGSLTLGGMNTVSGGIIVAGGTLVVANANNALGGNALTINGGTLSSNASPQTIAHAITFTGDGGLAADGSGDLVLSGPVSFGSGQRTVTVGSGATVTLSDYGTGGITKAGGGTMILDANATLAGLGVSAGTLQIADGVAVTTSSQPTAAGGTLAIDGTLTIDSTSSSVAPAGAVTVGASGVVIQQGNGSPTNFLFNGSGTRTWTPGSTFVYRDFTAQPSVSGRTHAMNVVFESTGGTVNVGAIAGSSPWTVQGDLTIGENVNFDYGSFSSTLSYSGDVIVGGTLGATNGARSFTIANGNELRLVNAGTLNIASDQTVTIDGSVRSTASAGQIATISGGTLSLGGGSRTFDVAAGTGGAGLTVSSNIENGSLIKTGGGALTLTGTNSFTGAAQIEEGTLVIGAASSLAGMSSIAIDAGTVLDLTSVTGFVLGSGQQLSGRGTILGDFEFGSGSLLVFDPNGPLSIGAGTLSFAFGSDFGVANLIGLDENTPVDTYTLFAEDVGGIIDTTNLLNFEMPVSIGGGKSAYFQSGSLQLVVVPEPSALLLGGGGLLLAGLGAWRRRLRAGLNVQAN